LWVKRQNRNRAGEASDIVVRLKQAWLAIISPEGGGKKLAQGETKWNPGKLLRN
jgi:hypothetical protein